MSKGKKENLISLADRPPEERRRIASKGGEARRDELNRRKALKEELEILLSIGDTQERIATALVQSALNGNVSAFCAIRDSIGEKPRVAVTADMVSMPFFNSIEEMTPEQLETARKYFGDDSEMGRAIGQSMSSKARTQMLEEMLMQ